MLLIRRQNRVQNSEISASTGLSTIRDMICKRCYAVFGHMARLPASTPANQALRLQFNSSLSRFPSADCKRRPGRLRVRWVDHMRQDNHSPADLWCSAIRRDGHSGATLLSTLTIRYRRHAFRMTTINRVHLCSKYED